MWWKQHMYVVGLKEGTTLKKRWAGYKHTLFKNPNAPSTTLSYNMLKCKNTNQKSKINLSIKSKAHAFPSGRVIVYIFPNLIFCWISAYIMSLCEISNQFSLCFVLSNSRLHTRNEKSSSPSCNVYLASFSSKVAYSWCQ